MVGIVGAIQIIGDQIHSHPHIHSLVAEGVFLSDGTYVTRPEATGWDAFRKRPARTCWPGRSAIFKCLIPWSFIERDQSEVIERLQCAKRTSPFGH